MNKWERKIHFQQNKSKYIKRGTIALSVVLLILGVIYITYSKFESTQEYTLINGKMVSNGDASIIAIYQGDTKVDSIPARDAGYYFDRAECSNGATASWNVTDWSLNVNTSGKTKCTLYFVQGTNAVTYINNLGQTDTTNLIADGTSDNNLRYVGANPNNYVRFNNELWRIIGVMNNIKTAGGTTESLIKLIRNESLGVYSWDSSDSSINDGYGINQWGESESYEGADLMRELNNDYLGNVKVGTDGKWYDGPDNGKWGTMPSSTLSQISQSMIENVVWNLGAPNNNGGVFDNNWWQNFTTEFSYTGERASTNGKICTSGKSCNDTVLRTTSWTGKIALMYPSDFGFATSGGTTNNRNYCLNYRLNDWNDASDCYNNDWLYKDTTQFTLSPVISSGYIGYGVLYFDGALGIDSEAGNSSEVFPSLYLKSSIAITGGEGTESNPYTLG